MKRDEFSLKIASASHCSLAISGLLAIESRMAVGYVYLSVLAEKRVGKEV